MGRRKNVGKQYIDICSACDKEIPYGDITKRINICPECGKRMIHTDYECCEVVKLLKEINLKPVWANSFWTISKDAVGIIKIVIILDMPCAEAMFSELPDFKYFNKNSPIIPNSVYINENGCALYCYLDSITHETVGVEYLGSSDVLQILDSHMKELKNWCEDYKENYEGRWAIGKLAGWLD